MTTVDPYRQKIQREKFNGLLSLWKEVLKGNTPDWPDGIALEYLILRAFELEGAIVKYSYQVKLDVSISLGRDVIEQIDGAIHQLRNQNVQVAFESLK